MRFTLFLVVGMCFNVAMAIMMVVGMGIDESGNSVDLWANAVDRGGLNISTQGSNDISNVTSGLSGSINPSADIEDNTNFMDRTLDYLHLGWVQKVITVMDNLVWGLPNFLKNIFSGWLSPQMNSLLFGATAFPILPWIGKYGLIYELTLLTYIFAIWEMRTGRSLLDL